MKIVIVTDAWFPQVNGVVRTMKTVGDELTRFGHAVTFITPDMFRSVPCPTYPEIRLTIAAGAKLGRLIEEAAPDSIHISTEGPLGLAARRWCQKRGVPFTTAFHTKFPEYVQARFAVPVSWSWAFMRWFHGPSRAVMVATPSMRDELRRRGLTNTKMWNRGVDLDLFRPVGKDMFDHLPRPVFVYVGRVAVEKNIEAFLQLDLDGTKVVIGDGPMMDRLQTRYPDVLFTGARHGEDLVCHFAAGDVFVFPSRTDTFGLVLLEAMACGLPVAAYPVAGPIDVVTDPKAGSLNEDLAVAVRKALTLSAADARNHALGYSWENCANLFLENLHPFDRKAS